MTTKRLAVIGCGLRSESLLNGLKPNLGTDWELAALADPNSTAIRVFKRLYARDQEVPVYNGGAALLSDSRLNLDAVIIGSPNALHTESVVPALRRKLTIFLEKPIATTIDDCLLIGREHLAAGQPPVAVGFVLRHTPFYKRIKELVENDVLGQILTINITECLGAPLTALLMRGWRRFKNIAGPFLLEKCSHDLDILNWIANSPAARVSSFATRTRFNPIPGAASQCRDCALAADCRYEANRIKPHLQRHARRHEIDELIYHANDLCVFNSDKDLPDHQVVNIEYNNGILATFSVTMDQPRTTRTIRISGTKGHLYGDIGLNQLRLERHLHESSETESHIEEFNIAHENSGHHGGDSHIVREFYSMLLGNQAPPTAGIREGIAASIIALAAEQSVVQKQVINVPS